MRANARVAGEGACATMCKAHLLAVRRMINEFNSFGGLLREPTLHKPQNFN